MLNSKERWVYFYDFKFKSDPSGTENIPLRDLLKGLKKLIGAKKAVAFYQNSTSALRITKASKTDSTVTLLIQLADSNISNPAFSNIKKGNIRVAEKEVGEGVAITAHVTIALAPHLNNNCYLVAIEKVPGIGASRIASFLTAMFRAVRKDEGIRVKDEQERNRIHRPIITSSGHLSESLIEDLEDGTLRGFDFISYQVEGDGFDDNIHLKPVSKSMKVGVSSFTSGNPAMNLVGAAWEACREKEYDRLRIHIKKDGADRVVDADMEDANNTLFVRHVKITLDRPIRSQCLENINNGIREKMNELILEERDD